MNPETDAPGERPQTDDDLDDIDDPEDPEDLDDPFRLGWRYSPRTLPDGEITYDVVPLPEEGLLYPEEDDKVVNDDFHAQQIAYFLLALRTFFAHDPGVVVLAEHRVEWADPKMRAMGPDVVIFFDVHSRQEEPTFRVAEEGGRPVVVLEVTSRTTRKVDLGPKIDLYFKAGIEKFVIVDRGRRAKKEPRLIGRCRSANDWVMMEPNARGQFDLAPVPLLLGIEGNQPMLYRADTGAPLPRYEALSAEHAQMLAELRAAESMADEMQAKVSESETKARESEAKVSESETKAREVEAQLQKEKLARQELEERLAKLQARHLKPPGDGNGDRGSEPAN